MTETAEARIDPDRDPGRGRYAARPSEIPLAGWYDIALRLWKKFNDDRTMLIAGGVTFYLLLAFFAAMAAFFSLFGLVTDPGLISREMRQLDDIVPAAWLAIFENQLTELSAQPPATLGIGLAISLGALLWTANNGVKAIFEALNVAYGEQEKRSFLQLHLHSFAFTFGMMLIAVILVSVVGLIPAILAFVDLGPFADAALRLARWMVLLPVVALVITLFYRHGPSRRPPAWRWVSWGSAVATTVWLVASVGYSFYLQSFADLQATYGSLGALVGFLLWIWLSVLILIVGAQLNAEMELQTRRDTTTPPEKPMGRRGAYVADTVGPAAGEIPR
jgi:membrane protein